MLELKHYYFLHDAALIAGLIYDLKHFQSLQIKGMSIFLCPLLNGLHWCACVKLTCPRVDHETVMSSVVSFVQRLISERDTLRETNDELRCAQVQQRCLSGAGEFAALQSHHWRVERWNRVLPAAACRWLTTDCVTAHSL